MIIPSSFLCFSDLINVYNDFTNNDNFFVTECYPKSILSTYTNTVPCMNVIGCKKQNESIRTLFTSLESVIVKTLTDETNFNGTVNKHLNMYITEGVCNIVSGKVFGYFDDQMKPLQIDDLMSDSPIELSAKNIGVDIPVDDIIERKHYDWFSKINLDELPKVNNNIGYLLKKIYN